jgi:cell division protein ZapA
MEPSTPEKQPVRVTVTILSRPYTLLATGDPREIEEVAAGVNDLMLSIASKSPNADSTRIAVLACMHLADKLRALQREGNRQSEGLVGAVEQLLAAVEGQ